jgi:hypothetical protein
MSLAAEVRRHRAAARLRLESGREDCRDQAAQAVADARERYRGAKDAHAEAHQAASAAWREARPARRQAYEGCMAGPEPADRAGRKARRETCETRAAKVAKAKRERHGAAKKREQTARAARSAAFRKTRGARRSSLERCLLHVFRDVDAERAQAERLDYERREEAKRRRGGHRPPVSPAERAAEEIQRARNDVEDRYPEALPLFEEVIKALHRRWQAQAGERERAGRTHTLGEAFLDFAHDSPELVEEARARDAERWAEEQMRAEYEEFERGRRR